jgi:hypothetical protein
MLLSGDNATETGPSSMKITITLRSLPPNTVKADIYKVKRIFMQLDGRRADVVFLKKISEVHGMKRTFCMTAPARVWAGDCRVSEVHKTELRARGR